jgi:hypothetical protein
LTPVVLRFDLISINWAEPQFYCWLYIGEVLNYFSERFNHCKPRIIVEIQHFRVAKLKT